MRKVIFDSSFMMAVAEHPTTWHEDMIQRFGKFEPVTLDCVQKELRRLSAGRGKKARYARLALELAVGFVAEPCGNGKVDDEIASAALTLKAVVATTDGELSRALKTQHVEVVGLRSGRVSLV